MKGKAQPQVIKAERRDDAWRANRDVTEVEAGDEVIFEFNEGPGRLWFPIPNQVEIKGEGNPTGVLTGQIAVRVKTDLTRKEIPYIYYLPDKGLVGDMLVAESPPYIKIKDPGGGTRGTGGD